MKILIFSLFLLATTPSFAEAAKQECSCKCVTREEDGQLTTVNATGSDRESAGDALKQKLKKRKCEISPVCEGSC